MIKYFILIVFLFQQVLFSQSTDIKYGKIYRYELSNTSFPHKFRKGGYVYKGQHFDFKDHYNDSSVLVFIPDYLKQSDSLDIVFYFHGWYNNIDSTLVQFNLIEQFYKSKKNAILVLAEGAKNSPDSFGGKLEDKDTFKDLVEELINELDDVFNEQKIIGNITLAGHSGAYRVIAFILMHGGLTKNISSVYLFDALYTDVEKFTYWLDNYKKNLIIIYTPSGGTMDETENLQLCLNAWEIPFTLIDDDDFSSEDLKENKISFIKSKLGHNDVVHTINQFQKFLESSF